MNLTDDMLSFAGVIVAALAAMYRAFRYGYQRGRASAFRDAQSLRRAKPYEAVRVEDPHAIPAELLCNSYRWYSANIDLTGGTGSTLEQDRLLRDDRLREPMQPLESISYD